MLDSHGDLWPLDQAPSRSLDDSSRLERGTLVIRRLLLPLTFAVLAVALVVPVASAAQPVKATEPFSGAVDRPAGTTCDFHYAATYTGTDVITEFSDRVRIKETLTLAHTNVDTGYTLIDTDVTIYTFYSDGSFTAVGVFWHLRDAEGKIVLVRAGLISYDFEGNVIKHTPALDPVGRNVICPALGGNAMPLD